MIVCSTGYDLNSTIHQSLAECLCVVNNILLVNLKFRLQCLFEADCLGCDHMHQWSALNTREDCFVKVILVRNFLTAQNHSASRSAQCLMRRCRHYMSIRNWAWMKSCCHKSCNMRHIDHEHCTTCVCDLTESLEINGSRISGCPCNDHFWFTFHCKLFHFIIINESLVIDTIWYYMKITSGKIDRRTMCQMSTMV